MLLVVEHFFFVKLLVVQHCSSYSDSLQQVSVVACVYNTSQVISCSLRLCIDILL
jgi:hypothetical protein